jgi:hypothetical protein
LTEFYSVFHAIHDQIIIIQGLKVYIVTTAIITTQHKFVSVLGILDTEQYYVTESNYQLEKSAFIALLRAYLYSSVLTAI